MKVGNKKMLVDIMGLGKEQLQNHCRRAGVPHTGTIPVLQKRLQGVIQKEKKKNVVVPVKKVTAKRKVAPVKEKARTAKVNMKKANRGK